MSFCTACGTQLVSKNLEHECQVPYCESCQVYRFPRYNVAVSAIIYDEREEQILLIQQYGRPVNVLVAGYVSMGEQLEAALAREIQEETGLTVDTAVFNASQYYEKNQVLMVNFACKVASAADLACNHEVDAANWFTPEEARQAILPNSIAQQFLTGWLYKGQSLSGGN